MKKITLVLALFTMAIGLSQTNPLDFETAASGSTWTWAVFENDDNPALEVIANPFSSGINTSATVAKFTARDAATGAQPYAGCVNNTDFSTFTLDATNSIVKIMVYKTVISDVGIKFEANLASTGELKVPNTLINQWEEITFDFSSKIGEASSTDINGIVIFPDFDLAGRTQDNVVYFDNITFSGQPAPTEPTVAAPVPTQDAADVISMFSDAYTDVAVDTWQTVWSASTYDDMYAVAGNATKKYTDLDFNGIETVGPNLIDASGMTHFHMDVWTPDANDFKIKLVDFGANESFDGGDDSEHELTFAAPATGQWISYDIPLADFTGLTSTSDLAQLIVSKGPLGTVYVDNVYFYYSVPPPSLEDITFEPGEAGNIWTWNVFENNDNPALNIVANANGTGINTSATVAEFTARDSATGAQPYAGTVSNDIPTFTLDATNSTVKIMVYKTVISDVGLKFEASGASTGEIKVPNTVINQWEELTFDFSGKIGEASSTNIDGIVIFPDFDARAQDNVIYFDNITFSELVVPTEPMVAAPTPTYPAGNVISLFSDAYTDVTVDTWQTVWSNSIYDDMYSVAGNATKKYTALDFNGIETVGSNAIDAMTAGMTHFRMDIWTPNSTTFRIKLVDFGGDGFQGANADTEFEIPFTPALGEWVSLDIPLTDFTGMNTSDISQIIISSLPAGTSDVYIDNVLFYFEPPTEPMIAAPTPTLDQNDVISLFSDVYTDVQVDTWQTVWSSSVYDDSYTVAGNPTKKYTNLDFNGIETLGSNAINASLDGMTHFHMHVWTPNVTEFRVKLVDFGGDGFQGANPDTESELAFTPAIGEWVSIDIPLPDFTGMNQSDISQFIISCFPTAEGIIFIDNVYFANQKSLSTTEVESAEFIVYPNPTANNWNIKSNQQINSIQIFDVLGKEVLSLNPNTQEIVINATSLNTGLYFARLNSDSGTETVRLVKK